MGRALSAEEIPAAVRQFIQSTIDSVDHLEVLLFLMSNPDRGWTVSELGERIRLTPEALVATLADLHVANLLAITAGPHLPLYRYAPESTALALEVAQSLHLAYKERRESVIQLIYTRPLDNIKVFADAFRLKKDED